MNRIKAVCMRWAHAVSAEGLVDGRGYWGSSSMLPSQKPHEAVHSTQLVPPTSLFILASNHRPLLIWVMHERLVLNPGPPCAQAFLVQNNID